MGNAMAGVLVRSASVLADKTRAAARATDTYVHEKPWESIAVGAGVGLLLGLVIARR